MKVSFRPFKWSEARVEELSDVLTPQANSDGGAIEEATALARATAEAVGKLAALLVERGHITLDEATVACGVWHDVDYLPGEGEQ